MKILKEQTSLPLDRRILITEGVASRVFKFENAARLKAQGEILDCNYASATKLVSNIGDSLFDQTIELFKSSETFSQKAKRFVYYNAIDTAISSGLSKNAAIQQVKLMYGSAMDSLGSKTSKASAEQLFKSNLDFFGCSNDIFSQFKDTSLSHGRPSSYIKNKYIGNDGVFHRTKLASDFDRFINSLNDSDIPSYVNVENIANYKSSSARKIFSQAYNDVLLGNVDGNPKDVAKVIAKILELSEDGKKIYIYNNGGKTCSHSQSLSINLCNLTIDGKDLGSIYHETGHFLYGNVLNKKLPDNFLSVRQKALDTLYSSSNEELLKTFKKNVEEVKIYSDYRVTKELNNFATSRGYKSISDYKNHLIDKYSQLNSSQRVKMLQTQNKLNGGFYEDELSGKINDVIDAEQFANLEIRSMKRKISDIISRSFDSYVKVTGMIDSLTMSKENIWYGHSENYFKSFSNPKLISYDEMVADYTALRVNGSNDIIGFLRQLFGNEMMDALEQTYQEMLN